jgi:hypothetical protein
VAAFNAELRALPQPAKRKYYEFAHMMSGITLRKILEDLVASDLLLSSPIAKENYAKGEAAGEAKAILLVLKTRGLTPTEVEHNRIIGCTDLNQLQDWVTRSVIVKTVGDLFA